MLVLGGLSLSHIAPERKETWAGGCKVAPGCWWAGQAHSCSAAVAGEGSGRVRGEFRAGSERGSDLMARAGGHQGIQLSHLAQTALWEGRMMYLGSSAIQC